MMARGGSRAPPFLWLMASIVASLLCLIAILIAVLAAPAFQRFGLGLLASAVWDPTREVYGILPAIVGTLTISATALMIAAPLAICLAVSINEFFPEKLRAIMSTLTDLSAAVPTVVYGLWGLFVLSPIMYDVQVWLHEALGGIQVGGVGPFSTRPATGTTALTAAVLLAIMIMPFATAVIREGYSLVPREVTEAIYALGATRWEAIRLKLRYIRNYVFGGLMLALGRAMGETVAVAMVVGGAFTNVLKSLTEPSITISALIALQFPNAQAYELMLPTLYAAALTLAAMGFAINAAAVYVLYRGAWRA